MSVGILIVDDSDYMRSRLKSALGDDEYHVVAEAPNGAWAVKHYQEHRDEVDLVLMDIVMDTANGVKATAAITELDADAKIVMCTSVGQHKKMKLAREAGADGYVTKPFSDEEVATAISEVLAAGESVGDDAGSDGDDDADAEPTDADAGTDADAETDTEAESTA
jgi:two-component system chemotaxis response regulator CheY